MFKTGDRIQLKAEYRHRHPGVYVVEKMLQVNLQARPEGGGRALRGRPELFEHVTGGETAPTTPDVGTPFVPFLWPGQVITCANVSSARWNYAPTQRFVVLDQRTHDRVKIARLGGEEGRTWTVNRSSCILVEDAR